MKIVRGYTVDTPLLVQGHPELVAKVGDVVRLYLDQVADPALPAFIRATVEHPIVSKSNCTGTSYSFSYNEALLTGAITRLRHEDIVDVIVYSTQGRSVYESYLLTTDDVPPLSESAWTDTVLRGPIGPQGSSAYQVAVANGFVGDGAQWLASLTGPTGPTGPTGSSGAGVVVADAITNGDLSAVTSNAVFDGMALKAPLDSPGFTGLVTSAGQIVTTEFSAHIRTEGAIAGISTEGPDAGIFTQGVNAHIQAFGGGNIQTALGQFIGAGTGLTGTGAGFTAGTVTTINGKITAGANITLSGAGTAASPYSIAAAGGATVYNVKDPAYGAAGDGVVLRDATMTSGSAVLTCASGAFVAGDVGKRIIVRRAGANQTDSIGNVNKLDLVGTISVYTSATQVTLSANAGSTISGEDAIYGTDSTAGIQAAITDCTAAGGGTVFIPKGIFFVDGAAQDISRSNCILKVPYNYDQIAVVIKGDSNFFAAGYTFVESSFTGKCTYGGSVLLRTAPHSGRIIGGSAEGNPTFADFTGVNLGVEDLVIRGRNGSDFIGVGGKYFACLAARNMLVDCGTSLPFEMAEPSPTSIGIEMPQQYNGAFSEIRKCWVQGFGVGYWFSEHTYGDNLVSQLCLNGMVVEKSDYCNYVAAYLSQWCKVDLAAGTGETPIAISAFSWEKYATAGVPGRISRWFNKAYVVSDPLNYLKGRIENYRGVASGGALDFFTTNGAKKLLASKNDSPAESLSESAFFPSRCTPSAGSLAFFASTESIEADGQGQGIWYNAAAANGGTLTWTTVFLEPGIYTLEMIGATDVNKSTLNWALDGVAIGTMDWYAAAAWNVQKKVTFTNKTKGYKTFVATYSKNALSSGYQIAWSQIRLVR